MASSNRTATRLPIDRLLIADTISHGQGVSPTACLQRLGPDVEMELALTDDLLAMGGEYLHSRYCVPEVLGGHTLIGGLYGV